MADQEVGDEIGRTLASKTDLNSVVQSKDHLLSILAVRGKYYLPPPQFCTWKFLRQVLSGTKELLKIDEIDCIYKPPRLQEIPVARLFNQIRNNPQLMRFFPETNRPMDKAYFFTVIASQSPGFYETILHQIKERRRAIEPEQEKIEISDRMRILIEQNLPYIGPTSKVGHFVKTGRRWGNPGPRQIPQFQIDRLF